MQPSFSRGELAPGLHGRVDIAAYQIALAVCRNFIPRPTGGVIKRPGFRFRGTTKFADVRTRLIPFVYSTSVKYLIEAGNLYFRFWVGGALLRDGSNNIVEVATPYAWDDIERLRFTQSADVLTLVHPSHAPRELRRLTSASFELRLFEFRRGPFRALNSKEAVILAVSGTTGAVNLSCNAPIFNANMVGQLVYMEEKELRSVRPWEPLERGVTVGQLRRSDGKVYRATAVSGSPGGGGSPYYITGNTRPLHEFGRAWDGPADTRSDGVQAYRVGVEWEYVHGGFGVVKITEYLTPTTAKGVVIQRVPDALVGVAPTTAGGPWTFSGDGSTKTFNVTGASSPTQSDYAVTIGGSPVSPDPYYEPSTGGNGPGGGNNTGNPNGEIYQQYAP